MSEDALREYQRDREQRSRLSEARHIRIRVNEARKASHDAAIRWPFELLQNALDFGARTGSEVVTVVVRQEGERAVFEHDGPAFTTAELAALLSGGSSKEFESGTTVGRYGSGFLVTHVLAERTFLRGLLRVEEGYEEFELVLDRTGDEKAILENIDRCDEAVKKARHVPDVTGHPSARFEYVIDDAESLQRGLAAFREALPYLYGTRSVLGQVTSVQADGVESWIPEPSTKEETLGGTVQSRVVHRQIDGLEVDAYTIHRFASTQADESAALVLTTERNGSTEVVVPRQEIPRIFRTYPLRGATFVPVDLIFDAPVEPEAERNRPVMDDADMTVLSDAFDAGVIAVGHACRDGWIGAHRLARISPATETFYSDEREKLWWAEQLRTSAEKTAALPIVDTTGGKLPAVSGEAPSADFIQPRLISDDGSDQTTISRMWPLVALATQLNPPVADLADDWSQIAAGWSAVGVDVNRVTVAELAEWVRPEAAADVQDLAIEGDRWDWLAGFVDLVGECWDRRSGVDTEPLEGLLPNQYGRLCGPGDLRMDDQVPELLKDVAKAAGLDVRQGLLATSLVARMIGTGHEYAVAALGKAIPRRAGPDRVEEELIEHFRARFPEDSDRASGEDPHERASVSFLAYLWSAYGAEASDRARRVPLLARAGIAYWSADRTMMGPVGAWNEHARPFFDAYPAERVLDDIYLVNGDDLVGALSQWRMAYSDPLISYSVAELRAPRLSGLLYEEFDTTNVIVRNESFGHIALLHREVIEHIQEPDQARALLGLVLCHAARNDSSWKERRRLRGFRTREPVEDIPVRGALWLADLRSRAWVPVAGEDGKPTKVAADSSTLRPLLDPAWLRENEPAVALLTECFNFDELDLRLLGIELENRERVRQGLARLLETGGSDPEFYEALLADVEARAKRQRDVGRSQRMGYAVQAAVESALRRAGLTVRVVDFGYDFEVTPPSVEGLEDLGVAFGVGPYFVEVKATTVGPARLTPAQAATATERADKFVLCVIDLRGVPEAELDQEWTADDVQTRSHLLARVGDDVAGTWALVQQARGSRIGLRNEAALRYEVTPATWEPGISIDEWIELIAPGLA